MTTLYVHEVVDIVGQAGPRYMELTLRFDTERAADRGLRLVGTWQVVGVTGRWPQVVNLWETVDGWEGWRRVVQASGTKRAGNAELASWWEEAYATRTGGFDRLLRSASPTPSLDQLVGAGVHGSLFVHELSQVLPGGGADYLAAAADEWLPVLADHGHRLVGLYEVLLGDTEVVTVWATDLDAHLALQQSDDERIGKWRDTARSFLTRWREELMVPAPGAPLSLI